jgi:hypothetical protein
LITDPPSAGIRTNCEETDETDVLAAGGVGGTLEAVEPGEAVDATAETPLLLLGLPLETDAFNGGETNRSTAAAPLSTGIPL